MKKLILSIIFSGIALAANANMASCKLPCKQEHNWYLQTTGSYGWHNKTKLQHTKNSEKKELGSVKQNNGFGGAIAIGYIMDCWRLELEGSHRHNKHKHNNAKVEKGGIKSNTSLMANIYYDIPVTDLISIYLGTGAGISSVNGKSIKVSKGDTKLEKVKKKHGHLDTVFAWQVMAGLSYAISDNVDLVTGYRLFATTKPNLANKVKARNIPLINSVELGLRFKF